MPSVAEPRQVKSLPAPTQEYQLGGSYVLGTSPDTWPEFVKARRPETPPRKVESPPPSSLASALREVASAIEDILCLVKRIGTSRKAASEDEFFPGVEYPLTPATPAKATLRLEGYVRSVGRGREDLPFSEEELSAFFVEDGNG